MSDATEPVGVERLGGLDPQLKDFISRKELAKKDNDAFTKEAKRCWRAYSDDPWPMGAREAIESQQGTPAVNFNLLLPTVNTVHGDQVVNRREIKAQPVDTGKLDAVIGGWITQLMRKFYTAVNGHRSEARAILEQLVTGRGWLHVYVDTNRGYEAIGVDWVPAHEIMVDPGARKDNRSDARFLMRRTEWELRAAQDRWPDKKELLSVTGGVSQPYPAQQPDEHEPFGQHGKGGAMSPKKNVVVVWEYQFVRDEPWVSYFDEAGDFHSVTKEDFEKVFRAETKVIVRDANGVESSVGLDRFAKLMDTNPGEYQEVGREEATQPPTSTHFMKPVYYTSHIVEGAGGGKCSWLDEPVRRPLSGFTYVLFNGFWKNNMDEGRVEDFGLVKTLIDTQLLLAKTMTQTVQMLAAATKGGGFIRSGLLSDPANFIETQGTPGKWHLIESQAQDGDIVKGSNPSFPTFHSELIRMLYDAFPRQSGVTEFLQGTAKQERSNVLVTNLQSQAKTMLAGLYDPVESGRLLIGKLILEIIKYHIPDHVIQRVLGEDAEIEGVTWDTLPNPQTNEMERVRLATAARLIKRKGVNSFDVSLDTGEATTYEKQNILSVMGQVMQSAADGGAPPGILEKLWVVFARALPMPKGQSNELADSFEEDIDRARAMRTAEGVLEALQGLDSEGLMAVAQQSQALVASLEQQAQAPGAEQQPM